MKNCSLLMNLIDKVLNRYQDRLEDTGLGNALEAAWERMEHDRQARQAKEDDMNQRQGVYFYQGVSESWPAQEWVPDAAMWKAFRRNKWDRDMKRDEFHDACTCLCALNFYFWGGLCAVIAAHNCGMITAPLHDIIAGLVLGLLFGVGTFVHLYGKALEIVRLG